MPEARRVPLSACVPVEESTALGDAEFEPRPPEQCAFDFPDTECDGWSTPDFSVRFASVRGVGSRRSGRPRQDEARVAVHQESGAVVFAVAHGVSGAPDSHLGALEVCRAAVQRLLGLLSQGGTADLDGVAHHATERLRQLAALRSGRGDPQSSASPADRYATTLVAGIVQQEPAGPRVRVCRIGGSGAWLLDRATGSYHALFETKKGIDTDLVSHPARPLPHVPDPVEQATEHLTPSEVLLVGTEGFDRALVAVWPRKPTPQSARPV